MTTTDAFFAAFAAARDSEIPPLFAEQFLYGDAGGARPITRDAFLAALPGRARMFAAAGLGRAELAAVDEHRLDALSRVVRPGGAAPRLDGGEPQRLTSSFLLHDDGHRLRAVAYLNHEGLPAT